MQMGKPALTSATLVPEYVVYRIIAAVRPDLLGKKASGPASLILFFDLVGDINQAFVLTTFDTFTLLVILLKEMF